MSTWVSSRSTWRRLRVDPSFRFTSLAQQNSYLDDMLQRTRSLPGIRAAGLSDVLPLAGDRSWQVGAKGQVYPKDQHPESYIRVVSDGYLRGSRDPLKAGRGFTERDRASSEQVVIVNETLARTLWPGQDALGQVVTQDGGRRVVGVVADVRHEALEKAGGSEMYTADAADRRLFRHGAGGANGASSGRVRSGDSSGSPADRSESAGPRVANAAGAGGQGGVTATISGDAAGWIRGASRCYSRRWGFMR